MKLITRDTDYAVRSLLYIAKAENKLVSTLEVNKELALPRPFMRKILQVLQKEGFLFSVKGKNGGFSLAKKPEQIMLIDLMKLFQGEFSLTECLLQKKVCPNIKICPIRKKVKNIEKYAFDELKGISLRILMG